MAPPAALGSSTPDAAWIANWNGVESVFAVLKRGLIGTYHHVSAKHAQSYLTSYAYRFNRRFRLDSIVERLAWAAVHTVPQPYRVVVADA